MADCNTYTGVHIHAGHLDMSKAFCALFVRENTFASLRWNDDKRELGIAFHTEGSEIALRLPIKQLSHGRAKINWGKFFDRYIKQCKMQRYSVTDIDMTRTGSTIVKFKLEQSPW